MKRLNLLMIVKKPDESLIDDILGEIALHDNERLIKACKRHAIHLINETVRCNCLLNRYELSADLCSYTAGYMQCLVDMGILQPDNRETFDVANKPGDIAVSVAR